MKDIPQLIRNQRQYFNTNETKPISFRITQLKKLKQVMQSYEKEMIEAIFNDFKKSEFDTYVTEFALVYTEINQALKHLKKWSKVKKVATPIANFPAKSYIIPEPLGTTLIISAWNYPYQMALVPVVTAIAAGCTVILKPSELPANTSIVLEKMFDQHFDSNYIAVVTGGITETTQLLEQKFDKIFFTGSTTVAHIVYEAAAKHLTPVTLELGGKSPTFVTPCCNLKMTAKRLVWAKFINAGQTCIAPDYILVHQSIQVAFEEAIINEIQNAHFNVADGTYVQIINTKNIQRLTKLIAVDKIIYGGKIDIENRIIEPTVLSQITFDDLVMQEEIFGPILPILTYTDLNIAINQVKKLPNPLACYIFTNNTISKKRILNELSFGGGAINDAVMHVSNSHLPFGGVGNSGIGSYHGEAGFRAFSHYKSILDKPTWLELNLKYNPHTPIKLKLIKWVTR